MSRWVSLALRAFGQSLERFGCSYRNPCSNLINEEMHSCSAWKPSGRQCPDDIQRPPFSPSSVSASSCICTTWCSHKVGHSDIWATCFLVSVQHERKLPPLRYKLFLSSQAFGDTLGHMMTPESITVAQRCHAGILTLLRTIPRAGNETTLFWITLFCISEQK